MTAGRHLVFPFLAAFLLTTKPEKSIADNITAAGVFQKHSKPVEKELFTRTNPMCELVEGIVTVPRYARVSKTEQNLDLQIDALKAVGCDPRRIFTDKQSGAKWDRRGLDAAMSHLREGDTLVVWKMDRLGRTVLQSVQFLNSLHQERIEFRSLTEGIDTNTPMGKFYFHMAAALAELERDRLIERTNAGLAAAKARGRKGGRKRALSAEQAALALDMMKDGGRSMAQVAKLMNVSRSTISRLVERAGGEAKIAVAAE